MKADMFSSLFLVKTSITIIIGRWHLTAFLLLGFALSLSAELPLLASQAHYSFLTCLHPYPVFFTIDTAFSYNCVSIYVCIFHDSLWIYGTVNVCANSTTNLSIPIHFLIVNHTLLLISVPNNFCIWCKTLYILSCSVFVIYTVL